MSYRSFLIGSISAVAMAAASLGAAQAGDLSDFHGTLSGDYANLNVSHGGGSADLYGVSGAGTIPLNFHGANVEGDPGYHRLSGNGADADAYNVGGSLFWTPDAGRLGATVNYQDFESGGSSHVTNYGGFAQWFANDFVTVGAKGGGFSGSSSTDGYYIGGQATGYASRDIALSAAIDYAHINHLTDETDYTLTGEWLVSETTPISVYGGYTYSELSNSSVHVDTWMVGLRIYTDGNGATTLVDRQRRARWAGPRTSVRPRSTSKIAFNETGAAHLRVRGVCRCAQRRVPRRRPGEGRSLRTSRRKRNSSAGRPRRVLASLPVRSTRP